MVSRNRFRIRERPRPQARPHRRSVIESLRDANIKAVITMDDPIPDLIECAPLPYLAVKRALKVEAGQAAMTITA